MHLAIKLYTQLQQANHCPGASLAFKPLWTKWYQIHA